MEKNNKPTPINEFPESKEILDLIHQLSDKLNAESRPLSSIVMLVDEKEENELLNMTGDPMALCRAILSAMLENKIMTQMILSAVGHWSVATKTDLSKFFSYIPKKKGGGNTITS